MYYNMEGNRREKERGFTLIELMLVIVILGILAGVAVTQFTGFSEQAKVAASQTDITQIKTALRLYELEMGKFPSDDEGIEELTIKTDEHKKLLEKMPRDPWGESYYYREESENDMDFPDIWSSGPNKQEGDEDDITSWGEGGGSEGEEDTGGTGGTSSSSSSTSSGGGGNQ